MHPAALLPTCSPCCSLESAGVLQRTSPHFRPFAAAHAPIQPVPRQAHPGATSAAFRCHQQHCRQARLTKSQAACIEPLTGQNRRLEPGTASLVLLAGGVGKRMGALIPKQYLEMLGQPIAMYSLQTLAAMREFGEVIIVCEPSYQELFRQFYRLMPLAAKPMLGFAVPGKERQDSVFNGFEACRPGATLVAIHDSARPLVRQDDVQRCMADALEVGAAVLGVPVKPTIKEVDAHGRVVKTLRRAALWEVQTPQVIRPDLLRQGFKLVVEKGLEVTDDVSLIEALGLPVRVTQGSYTNIKVTTPDDMSVAERFLSEHKASPLAAAA